MIKCITFSAQVKPKEKKFDNAVLFICGWYIVQHKLPYYKALSIFLLWLSHLWMLNQDGFSRNLSCK